MAVPGCRIVGISVEQRLKKTLPGGIFSGVTVIRSRTMAAIRGKHNKSTERALRMALVRSGIKGWRLHALDLPGRPDIVFDRQDVAVFVDGCFWHGCPTCGHIPKTRSPFWTAKFERNRRRDLLNTRRLRQMKIKVFRVWEHSLKTHHAMAQIVKKIRIAVGQRSPRPRRKVGLGRKVESLPPCIPLR